MQKLAEYEKNVINHNYIEQLKCLKSKQYFEKKYTFKDDSEKKTQSEFID